MQKVKIKPNEVLENGLDDMHVRRLSFVVHNGSDVVRELCVMSAVAVSGDAARSTTTRCADTDARTTAL